MGRTCTIGGCTFRGLSEAAHHRLFELAIRQALVEPAAVVLDALVKDGALALDPDPAAAAGPYTTWLDLSMAALAEPFRPERPDLLAGYQEQWLADRVAELRAAGIEIPPQEWELAGNGGADVDRVQWPADATTSFTVLGVYGAHWRRLPVRETVDRACTWLDRHAINTSQFSTAINTVLFAQPGYERRGNDPRPWQQPESGVTPATLTWGELSDWLRTRWVETRYRGRLLALEGLGAGRSARLAEFLGLDLPLREDQL